MNREEEAHGSDATALATKNDKIVYRAETEKAEEKDHAGQDDGQFEHRVEMESCFLLLSGLWHIFIMIQQTENRGDQGHGQCYDKEDLRTDLLVQIEAQQGRKHGC